MFNMMVIGRGNPYVTSVKRSPFNIKNIIENTPQNNDIKKNIIETIQDNLDNNSSTYQLTAKTADIMLLTCMDFRLIDDVVFQLNNLNERNKYDEFILAGSSLGYNTSLGYDSNGKQNTPYIAQDTWSNIFNTHIDLAISLHKIKEVYIIDHLDCGAYKAWYGENIYNENKDQKHLDNLKISKKTIETKYPDLSVRIFIMDLYGKLTEYDTP